MKGLDRYLTQEPMDYTPIYEAIYESVMLPDNKEFDKLSESIFTKLIDKCVNEEWSLEKMTSLAKRYYGIFYKQYFESSFWYAVATYEPTEQERKAYSKALIKIEELPFIEMINSSHTKVLHKVTDEIKKRKERDLAFMILTKLKCTYTKKCKYD